MVNEPFRQTVSIPSALKGLVSGTKRRAALRLLTTLALAAVTIASCNLAVGYPEEASSLTLEPLRTSVLESLDDRELSVRIALHRVDSLDASSRFGAWIVHAEDDPVEIEGENYIEVSLDSGSVTVDGIQPDTDYRVLLAVHGDSGFTGFGAISDRFSVAPGQTSTVELELGSLGYAVPFESRLDAGFFHSVYVDESDRLWGWGGYEDLYALGMDPPPEVPQQIDFEHASTLRSVTASESHTVFVDGTGDVWGVGQNWYHTLGLEDSGDALEDPARIEGVDDVAHVRSDYFHVLALTEGGDVYSWGIEAEYLLGRDSSGSPHYQPRQITANGFDDRHIRYIAPGQDVSAAIDSDNQLWIWGWNSDGQLGLDSEESSIDRPQRLEVHDRDGNRVDFVSIEAGIGHFVGLAMDGTVYAWGRNTDGQVGQGHTDTPVTEPEVVEEVESAVYVSAAFDTSFAVGADGTVWSWGGNFGLKLGQGEEDTGHYQPTPEPIDGLHDLVEIRGHYDHALARGRDGTVYSWGWDYANQLGRDVPEEFAEDDFDPEPGPVELP